MKWHYDLTGAEIILRDVPVYAAATLSDGEGLMLDATATSDNRYISVNGTGSAAFIDALGICKENLSVTSLADQGDTITTAATTTTPAISSVACAVTAGQRYAKAIINPFAVYLMEYDQGTASYCTCPAVSASTTWTQTVEQYFEGGWIYICNAPSTSIAANRGQLRWIGVSTNTSSYTLLSALTCTAAEKCIKIYPVGHRITGVNASAANQETKLSMLTSMSAGATLMVQVIENFVGGSNKPLEPMRPARHSGIQDSTLKFYADVAMINHVWNQLS
jgi:hypothetical protein